MSIALSLFFTRISGIAKPLRAVKAQIAEQVRFAGRSANWDVSPWKNSGSPGTAMWTQLYSCLLASPGYGTPVEEMQYYMAEPSSLGSGEA